VSITIKASPVFGPVIDRGPGVARPSHHSTPTDEVSETAKVRPEALSVFPDHAPQRATHGADDALLRRLVEIGVASAGL